VVWRKKAGAGYELNAEFFATGPDGAFDAAAAKTKINTAANTFNFSNWLITGDGISDITLNTENPYYGTALSADITIEPVFTTAVRKYTITFMNGQDIISAEEYDYGT